MFDSHCENSKLSSELDGNILKVLNPEYLCAKRAEELIKDFRSKSPFAYSVLPNFLDSNFLKQITKELEEVEWFPKNNDLYTFLQSEDLKIINKPNIKRMKEVIYSAEFRGFLQKVTGLELSSKVDASASKYYETCELLCHDDELDGRRVAFIFYLVPEDWNEQDGGTLDLFNVDENGQPDEIVESIVPKWNNFLFFNVTPSSFHQVSEVLSSKERLSISGWYHGAPIVRPPLYIEPKLPRTVIKNSGIRKFNLNEWISPVYLNPKCIVKMNKSFTVDSTIQLDNFLLPEKYEQLAKTFQNSSALEVMIYEKMINEKGKFASDIKKKQENLDQKNMLPNATDTLLKDVLPWRSIGPANFRQYETFGRWNKPDDNLPQIIKDCMEFFISPDFVGWIEKLTELKLGEAFIEGRRFRQGAYTMSQDSTEQHSKSRLDGYYFLCPEDSWDIDLGGHITYMDEEDELATLIPSDNSFCLVFCEPGCMKYVKYVNHTAADEREDFSITYWESPENYGI